MNATLMFSKASDEWATPQDFFDTLDKEFCFELDAAATEENAKCPVWFGGLIDALTVKAWCTVPCSIFVNPPYSQCAAFVAKAVEQARHGHTVVCLVPARTDTRWFHEHAWDATQNQPRPGVEVRFVKGRLKFGGAKNGAPFPSMLVIFRPSVSTT